MKAFPIRLFHAIVSGLVLGTILSIASLQLFQHSAAQEAGGGTGGSSGQTTSPPPPVPPVLNPTPDDLDGDGIPNTWETQFNHDPNNSADAASDFDNDGLTARQEWQLSVSTSGAWGNPLGHWTSETLQPPAELGIQYLYPQDINRNGEILLNCGMMTDGFYHDGAVLVDAEGNWTVIRNPSSPADGYIWCSDLNDNGDVVGTWSSSDWSAYEGFCWSLAHGYEVCQLDGERAFPARINNQGDWVGSIEDSGGSWRPAYVVKGVNMHSDRDWWPYVWYQDINDFGEALGAYYTAGYQSQHAFLAYGPWLHDTGLQGSEPEFDPNTYSWSYTVAMNSWGEFTAGSGGQRNGAWSYPGYVFDGEFREIRSPRLAPYYLYPSSISDDKTVAGWAAGSSWSCYGFVHRDGVTLRIDELIPGANGGNGAFVSGNRRIVALSADQQSVLVVAPDQDQDGDGMPDDWEKYYGFNPALVDSNADADGDGTNNLGEFLLRSDPNAAPVYDPNGNVIDLRPGIDTDGDGIPNVWEWENGLNYADPSDAPLDFDRDGYTNLQEFRLNTDPRGAPSYRVREVGPFPGASSVSLSSAVLGDGVASFSFAGPIGANVTESVFFPAKPIAAADGGQRPAAWSLLRSASGGSLSFTPSHGSQYTNPVAQAPGGASLCYVSGSPTQFVYWATPTSAPVMLSGASSANDISYLHNAKLSPSGNFLVATRSPASASGVYQPIIWKMPLSGTATFKPVRLIPPAGVTLSDWPALYVSDYGHVVATGTVGGQNRPILWTINETGTAVTSSILPPLPGGNWASVTGISNQSSPMICGTSAITGGQSRATVWNASGTATSLGTLPGGNYSTAIVISRGGKIAGLSNVLVGNTLKYQPFLASYDPASATWKLQAQGTAGSYAPSLLSINDSGEILGRLPEYTPVYRQIPCLWRHGRAYPLDAAIPASSGYSLDTIKAINPNGTLLATTWKEGTQVTVLLTPDSDTDGDGLPDAFENQHAFNAYVKNNPASDSDSDGLTDLDEYRNGTLPRNPDTDADGMKDGWEVSWGLLPLDPSDAGLDPDGDHVTNLRESQIGTNPTGLYKVETLPLGANTKFHSAGDDGSVIVQQGGADEWTPNNTFDYISAPNAAGQRSITPLNQNWSELWNDEYSWYELGLWLIYHNPGDGTVNAIAWDFSEQWDVNNCYASNWNDILLLPDCTAPSSDWINQTAISAELAAGGHLGTDTEAIVSGIYPTYFVSPGGKACVMRTASGKNVVVDQQGQFIGSLPDGNWQLINDLGTAVQLQTRQIPAQNGVPGYYAPELHLSSGQTIPIPNTPGETPGYTLMKFSDDGKVLLSRTVKTAQLVSCTRYFLFDIAAQSLARAKQPGIGTESIISLSTHKGRTLGTGLKPFQTTPDGTCIRLDALRIKNTPGETPTPYGTLYPKPLTPNHIASDGTITVTTTDNSGQTVILQIVPHNDADGDGVPDDWEADMIDNLMSNGRITTLPTNGFGLPSLDPATDYDGDGISAAIEFRAGTSDANADDYNATEVVPATVWTHCWMTETGIKTEFFKEFTPAIAPDPATPVIKYFMKKEWSQLEEANTTYGNHKLTTSKTTTLDRETKVATEVNPPAVYTGSPGAWPDWWSGSWTQTSQTYNHPVTKERDYTYLKTTYGRPTWATDNATGVDIFESETKLMDEYTTGMLMADVDQKFQAKIPEEMKKPWSYGWLPFNGFSTYTRVDETQYSKTRCDYAMEPDFHPEAPVRVAWLEVEGPDPGRGFWASNVVDPNLLSISLHQDYYSAADAWSFHRPPYEAKSPRTAVRPIDPGLNRKVQILPMECHLSLQHSPGEIIPERTNEDGTPSEPDWNSLGSGALSWSFSHNTSGGIQDILAEEFDVPIKLEAVKGGENIRIAYRTVAENGDETFTPVALPIDDLREIPNDFVLQSIAPGEVILKSSLITKHGLRVAAQSAEEPLLPLDVALDADRDGTIQFDQRDETTQSKPYQFWVNSDRDSKGPVDDGDWEEDDFDPAAPRRQVDHKDDVITCERDLEDLSRININLGAAGEYLGNDPHISLSVRMEDLSGGPQYPAINLFRAVEPEGGRNYLTDNKTGYDQIQGDFGRVIGSAAVGGAISVLPGDVWRNKNTVHLLFEGAGQGKGKLIFEVRKYGVIATLPPVYLDLKNVEDLYETWTVGDVDKAGVDYAKWPEPTATQISGKNLPATQTDEEKDYIMLVHGWNMAPWEKTAFGSTMFKRMWHQGYKGRFGMFRWPTFHGFEGDFEDLTQDPDHFNASELRAWSSASRLKALIENRAAVFGSDKIRLYAHSMGNIVCGEALRQFGSSGAPVHSYIAAQAAISSHVYDRTTPARTSANQLEMPNVYGYYWQQGASDWPPQWEIDGRPSYMDDAQYLPTNVTYINHYNFDDYALNGSRWPLNQNLKPGFNYHYTFQGLVGGYSDCRFIRGPRYKQTVLNFPADRYEIFSNAADSVADALGKVGTTGGKFSEPVNVAPLLVYDTHPEAHKYHSGQFRSTIQKRWEYWRIALDNMDIRTPAQ